MVLDLVFGGIELFFGEIKLTDNKKELFFGGIKLTDNKKELFFGEIKKHCLWGKRS